jgi:hypothetical protein
MHALTHGDLPAAFGFNALVVAAAPVVAVGYLLWAWSRLRGLRRDGARHSWERWVSIVVWVVALAFGVLRNLPAFAVLVPHAG